MKTIDKLRLLGFPDGINLFSNLPTTESINDVIVGFLMVATIKRDVQALQFCDLMDNLVDSKSSRLHIEILRKGKKHLYLYVA